MITFDEAKRLSNLEKHGLDFADAALVFDAPDKVTLESERNGEYRNMDIVVVEVVGTVLALVYVERSEEIRVISFRRASRSERRIYEDAKQN
jgi:uncharacterized protein